MKRRGKAGGSARRAPAARPDGGPAPEAGAGPGAPRGGAAPAEAIRALLRGQAQLRAKYAELSRKHGALVERKASRRRERTDVVQLALAVLRQSRAASALVRGGSVSIRERKWLLLLRHNTGEWRVVEPDGVLAADYPSLDDVAVAATRAIAPGACAVLRAEPAVGGRVFELSVARVGSGPSVVGVILAEDVTDRERAARELAQLRRTVEAQERVRELGILAAGVAHDLSNVIQGVQLRVELLRREAPALADAAQVDALARLAADAGKRLARLRELASGGAASAPGHIALRDAVLEATDLARPHVERASAERRRSVLMEVTVPDLLPPVVADPAELRHVLLNLVLNARDAMGEGGIVRVRAMHGGAWGIVTVSDEGTGFAPEHLLRAFEPFFTTKGERGSGLGLSGAAAFMRRVGGFIAVENRLDGGARVRLTFPAYRPPVAEAGAAEQRGTRRDA